MNSTKLNKISDEERKLIPIYLDKWRVLFSRSDSIDRQSATDLICLIYKTMNLEEPQLIFYDSPIGVMNNLVDNWYNTTPLWYPTWDPLFDTIIGHMDDDLGNCLGEELWAKLDENVLKSFGHALWQGIHHLMGKRLAYSPDLWKYQACLYDFCISVLGLECNLEYWQIFQSLVTETGWIYPFPKVCLVCDRPIKLLLDEENRLHADGESALEFADGFCIYAHHGVRVFGS
jgi:hypothetical protein